MGRVLFLTHTLPYPMDAGAKVRQYHMLRCLASRHKVTLVSFVRPEDMAASVDHLRAICHAVHTVPVRRSAVRNIRAGARGLIARLPMTIVRDENAEMDDLLSKLARLANFDVVHADQLAMSAYGLRAAAAAARRPRTILDEHNAVHALVHRMATTEKNRARHLITAREARAFARYEAATCRSYDAVLTVTEEDRLQLLALFDPPDRCGLEDKFTVIPICVDPDQVSPVMRRTKAPGEPRTLLHLGTMFWPPNVSGVLWFAREVLPLIHARHADVRFVVAGKNPPKEVQDLAADPRIQITGYVPDPRPYVETADVFVVPLHAGGGMRVKILDAWLWGLPVVTTPIGAEGLVVQPGENLLLASDARAFASATLELLENPELNDRLRGRGRAWVETYYSWESVYDRVNRVYDSLLARSVVQ